MDLSVFFAGTGGSIPTASRGLPALLVRRGGERLLFDCGEGTQRQLVRSVGLADLDAVFLTHFHADHWLGLPGLLKTFDLRGRERPLSIYGPPGLRELITVGLRVAGRVRYRLELVELEPGQALERDGYTIAPVPVSHRVHAFGYVLYEDERPGQFDPQAAARLGLAAGPEFGLVQRGATIRGVSPEQVLGPPRAGRKLIISGDTASSVSAERHTLFAGRTSSGSPRADPPSSPPRGCPIQRDELAVDAGADREHSAGLRAAADGAPHRGLAAASRPPRVPHPVAGCRACD